MNSELYIFVIWESGRSQQDFLFKELEKKFVIRDVYEITWNEKKFLNNMRRFYGPKLGDVNKKISMCGTGAFLLILISDPDPKFEKRRTSNGMEIVNINLYDYKKIYRKFTGLGYAIHSSVTYKETNDDLTLLLGKNTHDIIKEIPEIWNGSIKKMDSDIIGQNGWRDMNQLFYVLNSTINYVVLRNFEDLPEKFLNYEHNDIDFMTDDFLRIPFIANGGKSPFNDIFPSVVKIGEKTIPFHFEHPRDGNYDEKWAKDILKRRVLYHGFYIPSKKDYFYSLFYHVVFHQKDISKEYKNKLMHLAKELHINEITEKTVDNLEESKKIIEKFMNRMGYHHPDSTYYKIIHNKFSRFVKTSIYLWRVHGMNFLLTAIKIKIKRTISKSPRLKE